MTYNLNNIKVYHGSPKISKNHLFAAICERVVFDYSKYLYFTALPLPGIPLCSGDPISLCGHPCAQLF